MKIGYTLMIDTICQGTIPSLWEGVDQPVIFDTREDAQADIDETREEFARQIAAGDRDPDDTDFGEWIEPATLTDDGTLITDSCTFTRAHLVALRS